MEDTGGRSGRSEAAGGEAEFRYRGNRIGRPESGPGSVPGFGRRLAALFLDWLLSVGVAAIFLDPGGIGASGLPLLIFAAQNVILLTLFGTTIGKRILGIGIAGAGDRELAWPVAMLLRTVLLCLVIPAVVYDRDQRGLHDRAAGTISVRLV